MVKKIIYGQEGTIVGQKRINWEFFERRHHSVPRHRPYRPWCALHFLFSWWINPDQRKDSMQFIQPMQTTRLIWKNQIRIYFWISFKCVWGIRVQFQRVWNCCFARNPNKLLPAPITGCCRYQISDFKNLRKLCLWPKLDPLAWKNAANVWWTAPVRWLSLKYTF